MGTPLRFLIQGAVNRPAESLDALFDQPVREIVALRPFGQCQRFSVVSGPQSVAAVSHVDLARHPATIFWSVVVIIVNAVKLMFGAWTFAHIRKEISKRIFPAVAHCNAARSIARIRRRLRIAASRFHSPPSSVFRRMCAPVCCVSLADFRHAFTLQTSTTLRASITQVSTPNHDHVPAYTFAAPTWIVPFVPHAISDNFETAKLLINEVDALRHAANHITERVV